MSETPLTGFVLKYTVQGVDGDTLSLLPIVVAEPDPQRALALIKGKLTDGESVEIASEASASLVKAFGLKRGQFTQW